MGDLLIRNIPDDIKDSLRIRAAQNGRSQQAEALDILKISLRADESSWFSRLLDASEEYGGIELPAPTRHAPRDLDFAL